MSDILAEMRRYAALFDDSPRASRLECGERFVDVLRAISTPSQRQPWQPPDLSAIPIVVRDDMPPLAWRMLDQRGEIMREGTVAP